MAKGFLNPSPNPLVEEQQIQQAYQAPIINPSITLGNINYKDLYNLGSGPTMCSLGECADIPAMWQRVRQTGDYSHAPVLESNVQTAARNWAKAMLNKDNMAGLSSADAMSQYLNKQSGATNNEAQQLMRQMPTLDYQTALNKAAAINAQNAGQFGDANTFGIAAEPGYKRAVAGVVANNLAYKIPTPKYIDQQTGAFINPYSYTVDDNGALRAHDNITGHSFDTSNSEALLANYAMQSKNPYETLFNKANDANKLGLENYPKYLNAESSLVRSTASLYPKISSSKSSNSNSISSNGIPELSQGSGNISANTGYINPYQDASYHQLQSGYANSIGLNQNTGTFNKRFNDNNKAVELLASLARDPSQQERSLALQIGAKNDAIDAQGKGNFAALPSAYSPLQIKARFAQMLRKYNLDPSFMGLPQHESEYRPWISNKTGTSAAGFLQYTKPTWAAQTKKYFGRELDPSLRFDPDIAMEVFGRWASDMMRRGYTKDQVFMAHYGGSAAANRAYARKVNADQYKALYNINTTIPLNNTNTTRAQGTLFGGVNRNYR